MELKSDMVNLRLAVSVFDFWVSGCGADYLTAMETFFGWFSSFFGNVTVSTPFS